MQSLFLKVMNSKPPRDVLTVSGCQTNATDNKKKEEE